MRHAVFILVSACLFTQLARADAIAAQEVKAGDSWVYQTTIEKGSGNWTQTHDEFQVTASTARSIYYTVHTVGSTQPPKELFAGTDWSRVRTANGEEFTVNRPLAFPLYPGKGWEVKYTDPTPEAGLKTQQWDSHYTVAGLEDISVPAGKFTAIRIVEEGEWKGVRAAGLKIQNSLSKAAEGVTILSQTKSNPEQTVSGRTHKEFWYVPAVKRWVKSVEQYYGSNGERSAQYTSELESYKLADH